jgi:hypothetical protein
MFLSKQSPRAMKLPLLPLPSPPLLRVSHCGKVKILPLVVRFELHVDLEK